MTQNLHPFDIISNLLNVLDHLHVYSRITIMFYPDESGYVSGGGRKTLIEFRNLDEAIGQLQQLVSIARAKKSLNEIRER